MRSQYVKDTIRKCRQLLDGGDKGGFNNQKRKLPGFVFMSEIMPNTSPDKKGNPRPEDRWRVQEAARLNGLVMCDYDVKENPTLTDPRQYWEQFISEHQQLLDETDVQTPTVMLVHVTPGRGLRLVITADRAVGNLYDNALRMAGIIGLKSDDSCKDASRTSFAPQEEDILYLNEHLFTYDDADYDKAYGSLYREDGGRKMDDGRCKMDDGGCKMDSDLAYHGTAMQRICDAWILENPKVETRHGKSGGESTGTDSGSDAAGLREANLSGTGHDGDRECCQLGMVRTPIQEDSPACAESADTRRSGRRERRVAS